MLKEKLHIFTKVASFSPHLILCTGYQENKLGDVELLSRRTSVSGNGPSYFSPKEFLYLYPPQTLFVGGILFSRCPSVRNALFP